VRSADQLETDERATYQSYIFGAVFNIIIKTLEQLFLFCSKLVTVFKGIVQRDGSGRNYAHTIGRPTGTGTLRLNAFRGIFSSSKHMCC
jgi:hypothetical protein